MPHTHTARPPAPEASPGAPPVPHTMPRRRFLTRSARACLTQVLLITAAAVVEGIRDPFNWIGICIFFGSVIWYAYLTYEAKQAAKKSRASSPVKPTESSKLVP